MHPCPHCGAATNPGDTHCAGCGGALAAPPPPPPPAPTGWSRGQKIAAGIVALIVLALIVWAVVKYGFGGGHTPPGPHDGGGQVDGGGANPDASSGTTPTPPPDAGPPTWSQGQPVPPGFTLVTTTLGVGGTVYSAVNGTIRVPYGALRNYRFDDLSTVAAGGIYCNPPIVNPVSFPALDAPLLPDGGAPTGSDDWEILPGQCIQR